MAPTKMPIDARPTHQGAVTRLAHVGQHALCTGMLGQRAVGHATQGIGRGAPSGVVVRHQYTHGVAPSLVSNNVDVAKGLQVALVLTARVLRRDAFVVPKAVRTRGWPAVHTPAASTTHTAPSAS